MKIAILLATYKPDLELLRKQLESVREQSHKDWVLVVRDDCSLNLGELRSSVHSVVAQAHVIQASRREGAVANFAGLLDAIPSDCELAAFCDQDDEWEPQKLERLVREFADSRVMAAHSDLSLVDRVGSEIAPSCWRQERRDVKSRMSAQKLIFRNSVTGCTLMFRRSLIDVALPMPPQPVHPPYFYHDVWIALAALAKGEVRQVHESLVRYRQHGGNAVGAEQARFAQGSVRDKCLKALQSRRELESAWLKRVDGGERMFTAGFDFGLRILVQTIWWSLTLSSGYLRIGLQLALGKFLWDLGFREKVKT